MIKFTTESGAEYVYDSDSGKIVRLDGPEFEHSLVPDGWWVPVIGITAIEVGFRVQIDYAQGVWRTTTPVVSIEEVS